MVLEGQFGPSKPCPGIKIAQKLNSFRADVDLENSGLRLGNNLFGGTIWLKGNRLTRSNSINRVT